MSRVVLKEEGKKKKSRYESVYIIYALAAVVVSKCLVQQASSCLYESIVDVLLMLGWFLD